MTKPTESNPKNVYALIAAVSAEIAKVGISKDQTNAHQKYQFRGIDDVYNVVGPIMARHGLVLLPNHLSRTVEVFERGQGGKTFLVQLETEFTFVSVHDGSVHSVRIFSEAADTGDKATSKAMSMGYKTLCFQAFCIPVEGADDGDSEPHEVANASPAQRAPVKESKAAAKEVAPATISEEEEATVRELLEQIGDPETEQRFFAAFKIGKISELRVIDYSRAVSKLRATLGAKGGK